MAVDDIEPTVPSLTVQEDGRPATAAGEIGCVMNDKAITLKTADSFKFQYKTNYAAGVNEIEWPNDTMFVVLPADYADYLVREGYARVMTEVEADTYNKYIKGEKP